MQITANSITLRQIKSFNYSLPKIVIKLVKKVAAEHFRTIAGIPLSASPQMENMPDRWQCAYMPDDTIDPFIYQDFLASPSDDEWKETINSLPNNKAAALQESPTSSSNTSQMMLKLLITECFNTSEILSQWKDVTIYPIPKPYD